MKKRLLSGIMAFAIAFSIISVNCSVAVAYDTGTRIERNTFSLGGAASIADGGYTYSGKCFAAAIKSDASLWMWGDNTFGQLGNGTKESSYTPTHVMDGVASVSAGGGHVAAIKTDGSLWTWGTNRYGQLGDGTQNNSSLPIKIMDEVVAVSAGGHHTAAIKSDGTLWIWGSNGDGKIGINMSSNDLSQQLTPQKVLNDVIAISAGQYNTAAVTADGKVWTCGANIYGEIGNGATDGVTVDLLWYGQVRVYPEIEFVNVLDGADSVNVHTTHMAAIKKDGTLWMWGSNKTGQLANDGQGNAKYQLDWRNRYPIQTLPTDVMRDVKKTSVGYDFTTAIKIDGTLWTWGGNTYGQLGNGTNDDTATPVLIMRDAVAASGGYGSAAAIKSDGSLWMWGDNSYGQLGTGDTDARNIPYKVMDGVLLPDKNKTNETITTSAEYIYDTTDPGNSVTLNTANLDAVTNTASATSAVQSQVQRMTSAQKSSATGADLATLYAETAVAKAASTTVSGTDILINRAAVTELEAIAKQTSAAVEAALVSGGVATARYLSNTVTLVTEETGEISIRIDPDILTTEVDKIVVEAPTYAITLKLEDIEDDLTQILTITAQDVGSGFAPGSINKKTTVKVNLPNGKTSNPVTLSLPKDSGDTTYQAVVSTSGTATSSKYNPATTTMDGKVSTSGSYTVKTNQKDFSDIANKSAEMQNAIRYLASKGIINGTDATHFSPDGSITRAEIAALMVRALGKLDNSAKPTFKDVTTSNWYYATAASSQKAGLINGYEDNTFRGGNQINKEQIVAVSARVLTNEMGYKAPSNASSYLGKYSDSVVSWAQPEVALATRENLVVYRTDGTFSGAKAMTRGDAAIIIYRLFQRIW